MTKFYGRLETYRSVSTYGGIFCKPCHDFLKISKFLLSNMGEVLRKFSKNRVMEIHWSHCKFLVVHKIWSWKFMDPLVRQVNLANNFYHNIHKHNFKYLVSKLYHIRIIMRNRCLANVITYILIIHLLTVLKFKLHFIWSVGSDNSYR